VYSQWSFAELQGIVSYKAALSGSLAIKVDADYTSKACPDASDKEAKAVRLSRYGSRCGGVQRQASTLRAEVID
jgi:transposase